MANIIGTPTLRSSDKLVQVLSKLSKEEIVEFVSELTEDEMNLILYNWDVWAREEQLCFRRKEFIILVRAGRGWGKTRFSSEAMIEWERKGYRHFGICNASPAAVRDINILGESGIIACAPPWNKPEYQSSKAMLVWRSGAKAKLFSGANPEQSRGYQSEKLILDELFAYKYPEETYDNLVLGCRLGDRPQIIIPSTPKPTALMKRLMLQRDTIVVTGSTFDNKANLAASFIMNMEDKYGNSRLGRQELYGDILDDNPDAIFNRKYIDGYRVSKLPTELKITIVSVDPSVSNNKKSNETGIIVMGLGLDNRVYVLEDTSLQAEPAEWAKAVVKAYQTYNANYVLYEANQGGLLVESVIRGVDDSIPFKSVFAKKGKIARAEPVAVQYEQGKVSHVGTFANLEDQMCEYETGQPSPDKLDALVHGVTHLLLEKSRKIPIITATSSSGHNNSFSSGSGNIFKGGNIKWLR